MSTEREQELAESIRVLRVAMIGACGTLGRAAEYGAPDCEAMRDVLRQVLAETAEPLAPSWEPAP